VGTLCSPQGLLGGEPNPDPRHHPGPLGAVACASPEGARGLPAEERDLRRRVHGLNRGEVPRRGPCTRQESSEGRGTELHVQEDKGDMEGNMNETAVITTANDVARRLHRLGHGRACTPLTVRQADWLANLFRLEGGSGIPEGIFPGHRWVLHRLAEEDRPGGAAFLVVETVRYPGTR